MAKTTTCKKPVTRVFQGLLARSITVILYPRGVIGFREYRARKVYTLPLVTVYKDAILADLEAQKAAKKKSRRR